VDRGVQLHPVHPELLHGSPFLTLPHAVEANEEQDVAIGTREELLAAAKALRSRGIEIFSPAQLIAEARASGCAYPITTLRTFINGPMCVNSPDHHAVQYGDFERAGRGQYRLVSADRPPLQREAGSARVPPRDLGPPPSRHADWFWEGNVQAAVVRHLVADRWSIRRVASTDTREHGVDIEADRGSERLLVEVKGYPGTSYAAGSRVGDAKPTPAAAQARAYFSNALLSGLLMSAEAEGARVALAFPAFTTYSNLAPRVAGPLTKAGIEVWLVSEDGVVSEEPGMGG